MYFLDQGDYIFQFISCVDDGAMVFLLISTEFDLKHVLKHTGMSTVTQQPLLGKLSQKNIVTLMSLLFKAVFYLDLLLHKVRIKIKLQF